MNLYRATFQAPRSGTVRRMTYAASSQAEAERIARDWQIDACRPLTVRALRPLCPLAEAQQPLFSLMG